MNYCPRSSTLAVSTSIQIDKLWISMCIQLMILKFGNFAKINIQSGWCYCDTPMRGSPIYEDPQRLFNICSSRFKRQMLCTVTTSNLLFVLILKLLIKHLHTKDTEEFSRLLVFQSSLPWTFLDYSCTMEDYSDNLTVANSSSLLDMNGFRQVEIEGWKLKSVRLSLNVRTNVVLDTQHCVQHAVLKLMQRIVWKMINRNHRSNYFSISTNRIYVHLAVHLGHMHILVLLFHWSCIFHFWHYLWPVRNSGQYEDSIMEGKNTFDCILHLNQYNHACGSLFKVETESKCQVLVDSEVISVNLCSKFLIADILGPLLETASDKQLFCWFWLSVKEKTEDSL